jgi:hypothetical protein
MNDPLTTDQPAAPKQKLRWFQYSLRTLLIFVTFFAVACSWFAVKMQQAKRQREAVEAILKAGGEVAYDYQCNESDEFTMPDKEPSGPAWLRKIIGDDSLHTVVYAHLENDALMLYLKDLNKIRFLILSGSEITNIGLEQLKGLTQLQWLQLSNPNVTDTGLRQLKGLTQLKRLVLGVNVTDTGVEHLKGLSQLKELFLRSPNVTDAGLEHLKDLTQLQRLAISLSPNVTDAGLEHLKGLTQLTNLILLGTRVTDEGKKKLQQALPNCKIEH